LIAAWRSGADRVDDIDGICHAGGLVKQRPARRDLVEGSEKPTLSDGRPLSPIANSKAL